MANLSFKSIPRGPIPVSAPAIPTPKPVKGPRAKYVWRVIYRDGREVVIDVARGRKDAVLQSMWIIREETGQWPSSGVREVQKRPRGGNSLMYLSYRTRG